MRVFKNDNMEIKNGVGRQIPVFWRKQQFEKDRKIEQLKYELNKLNNLNIMSQDK